MSQVRMNLTKFEKVSLGEFKKRYKENAEVLYENIKLPKRATKYSAGYDFFSPFDFTLNTGETILIPTGIRSFMNPDQVLMIFPRSGYGFKYRIQLDNTVGIIDADYVNADNEGHIMIKITNDGHEGKVLEVKKGDGFCQGIFLNFGLTCDDDGDGERTGGFGSTSTK